MSLTKGAGKAFSAEGAGSLNRKSYPGVNQLSQGVADVNLGSSQDGDWEEVAKKNKRAGRSSARQWTPQNSSTTAWGKADTAQRLGIRANNAAGREMRQQPTISETRNVVPAVISPPLQHAWNWAEKLASTQTKAVNDNERKEAACSLKHGGAEGEKDDEEEDAYTEDDEDILSDDFDSDDPEVTHETRKQHRMLKKFFETLDQLTVEEINEPSRQWHCPACQGGPGAIDWFKGLQPLLTHARTKGSKRVKLHRDFAELMGEELRRRGTSLVPAGESFGKWEGLKQEIKDHEIVWPPMVVIMNTKLDKDDNDKWLGMGNQELLDYFQDYAAIKARHSYGPQGHRGMSILIFESSCMGYLEAERLHKHFLEDATGRESWMRNPALFYPGGKRQLYGYMAMKKDLDDFNKHCQGKSKLKFDMLSYQEMVVSKMRQMSEDNQQLVWFKSEVAKEQRHSKALEESFNIVAEKLRKTVEENRIVRQRTKLQHEQNKEEMDYQEQFYKDQMETIHQKTDEKEDKFEMIQQQERKKVEDSTTAQASGMEESRRRAENLAKFIEIQEKEMEEFVAQRDKLIEHHESKKVEMKKRHWQEELGLEKELDEQLTKLMENYTPQHSKGNAPPA